MEQGKPGSPVRRSKTFSLPVSSRPSLPRSIWVSPTYCLGFRHNIKTGTPNHLDRVRCTLLKNSTGSILRSLLLDTISSIYNLTSKLKDLGDGDFLEITQDVFPR